jgi:hypothetical protein
VLNISETSCRVQANMTTEFVVNYLVLPSTQPPPNATYVERNGALLPKAAGSSSRAFLYEAVGAAGGGSQLVLSSNVG